ncbi:Dynactin subunit 5 [Fusarium oxysporum f. sp. albedinis]|nr:Dynactin subunit 5 [Fusarium oxysporum f. sp. albedinis]
MAKNTSIHMETESDTDFSNYFINSFFSFSFFPRSILHLMKPCLVSDGCTSGEILVVSLTITSKIKATGLGYNPLDVSSRELDSQVTQLSAIIASSRDTQRRIYFLPTTPSG